MHRSRLLADLALLFVALIWGSTFVMMKDAVSRVPVFTLLALRFSLALAFLAPVLLASRRRRLPDFGGAPPAGHQGDHAGGPAAQDPAGSPGSSSPGPGQSSHPGPSPSLGAIVAGGFYLAGYAFQTAGLQFTTTSKAGFITGLSVVIVPVLSALFLRQRPQPSAVAGVVLAVAGFGVLFLEGLGDLLMARGDLLVLGCAFAFAAQIVVVGRYASRLDPASFTAVQLAVMAGGSWGAAVAFEGLPGSIPIPWQVWAAAGFTGLFATTLALLIQTAAQRYTTPTHTALLFATEPVFAAAFGRLLAGEVLTARAIGGSALILAGMLAAEIGPFWRGARQGTEGEPLKRIFISVREDG